MGKGSTENKISDRGKLKMQITSTSSSPKDDEDISGWDHEWNKFVICSVLEDAARNDNKHAYDLNSN